MRKVLIVISSLIVISGLAWYWYNKTHQPQPGVPTITDFSAFFPLGYSTDPTIPIDGVLPTTPPPTSSGNGVTSQFTQLSPHPVAGFAAYTKLVSIITPADPNIPKSKPTVQTVTKHFLHYVARSTGYVYEIEDGGIPLQVSNVYIPNVYEAYFADTFNTAILRFLRTDQRTIATYTVPVPPLNTDGTRTQKQGVYFTDNISTLAISPDGASVAQVIGDSTGAVIRSTTASNTKSTDVIKTPFTEWLISWPTQKSLYVQTKPSAQVPGYLYKVDTTEKKLRRVLGDINGLTTSVSPSGTYVLYSQQSPGGFVTRLLNTKTSVVQTLNLAILPEKCTWLKTEDLICAGNTTVSKALYPDDWYKGTVTFSDQLYRIYTSTTLYDTLYNNSKRSFDMTNLAVDESLNALYFIDKPTGLLWKMSY